MRSEKVTVNGKEYVVSELKWRDLREVYANAVKVRSVGAEPVQVEFNPVAYFDALLRKAVTDSGGNPVAVDELSVEEVEALLAAAIKLNPFITFLGGQ